MGAPPLLLVLSLLACTGQDTPAPIDSGTPTDTVCTPLTWTVDLDGDGWAGDQVVEQCEAPADYAELLGDCDDENAEVHPDAAEVCDGVDNDCDGVPDPPDLTWYADADGDGYGDPDSPVQACARPEDAVADATDCDDSHEDTWPGAEEVCGNENDEDCDGGDDVCALDPLLTFDDADLVLEGEYPNNYYGVALFIGEKLTTTGDALVVSSIDYGNYSTGDEVHVYAHTGSTLARVATITPELDLAGLGLVIHSDGDYTGDGERDLALFQAEALVDGYEGAGQVYVFSAPVTGTMDVGDADLRISGSRINAWTGHGLSRAVDWGREAPVIAVGARSHDITVGSETYQQAGSVFVLELGAPTLSVDDALATIECYGEECQVGNTVAAADVDGDGLADLVAQARHVGGPTAPSRLGVFLGPFEGTVDITDADGGLVSVRADWVGEGMELVGDIDDDGIEDLMVPAPVCALLDEYGGCIYLYSGTSLSTRAETGVEALATIAGQSRDTWAGQTVSHGDINGDGALDVVSSYDVVDESFEDAGRAWLWYGPFAGTRTSDDADVVMQGSGEDARLGYALSATGDLDGDGCDDITTSEVTWSSAMYTYAGRVGVWLGPCS